MFLYLLLSHSDASDKTPPSHHITILIITYNEHLLFLFLGQVNIKSVKKNPSLTCHVITETQAITSRVALRGALTQQYVEVVQVYATDQLIFWREGTRM